MELTISRIKSLFKTAKTSLVIIAVTLSMIEVTFRLLPVSESLEFQAVDETQPYAHFLPNRTVIRSIGANFSIVNEKRINNYGYLSDIDYSPSFDKKKIVVIGDSYVEAFQVKNSEAVHGYLDNLLPKDFDVYGIGISGSPLTQYLAFARFAKETFSPTFFVFVIIANDFDESLLYYKNDPGFHYYDDNFNLVRVDYDPPLLLQIFRHSAFMRYLYLNLRLVDRLSSFSFDNIVSSPSRITSETRRMLTRSSLNWSPPDGQLRVRQSESVVAYFFKDLQEIIGSTPSIFLLDANRHAIYFDGPINNPTSFFDHMFNHFLVICQEAGHECIDMTQTFEENYRVNKEHFEFDNNWHWNPLGHQLAADEIFKRISVMPCPPTAFQVVDTCIASEPTAPSTKVSPSNPNSNRNNNKPSVRASFWPSPSMSRYWALVSRWDSSAVASERVASLPTAPSDKVEPEKPKRCRSTNKPSVKASLLPSPSISKLKDALLCTDDTTSTQRAVSTTVFSLRFNA